MNRRRFLKGLGAGALLAELGAACSWLRRGHEPPNIVLVVADCWRWDCFGPQATPKLWALARHGVRFVNYFVNAGATRPSVASLLSGLPPSFAADECGDLTGFTRLPDAVDPLTIPASLMTFPELLRTQAGYLTMHLTQNPVTEAASGWGDRQWTRHSIVPHSFGHGGGALLTEAALSWRKLYTRGGSPKPFLLYLHYMDAHRPYNLAALARTELDRQWAYHRTWDPTAWRPGARALRTELLPLVRAEYARGVATFDGQAGRLIESVLGEERRPTLVFVTADHGEMFDETGELWNIGHDGHLTPEIVHVPMVVLGHGIDGRTVGGLHEGLELAPTILRLAGLEPEEGMAPATLLDGAAKRAVHAYSPFDEAIVTQLGERCDFLRKVFAESCAV